MLLTLAKPPKSEFDFKTHDWSPTAISSAAARFSPKLNAGLFLSQPTSTSNMGTPHRGLPPPSAMTLPDPGRGSSISQPMGSLPPAPTQWQGAEDGMKNWLVAKAEEEKRRQEEERTRQEDLRVEQRRIEQSMLRESLQGGVPPHLIPLIFAGMGGGSLASISADMLREHQLELHAAQRQAQAQSQSQLSPELRRETRLIGQPQPAAYGGQPQTPQTVLPPTAVLPGQPLPSQPQHGAFSQSPYAAGSMSPRARAPQPPHVGAPTSAPRPPQSQLPRLTTNELHIQQPPAAPSNVQQLHSNQAAQHEQQSSPSIYFHHWVPPNSQQEKPSSGNPPATPSGKYKALPSFLSRQRATSHTSDPDYTSSPKKRKAQGGHTAPPPPTTAPQSYTSPSFSHVSTSSTSTPGRRGHTRARSDASTRGPEGRSGALSRRGTVSTHAHAEAGAQHYESAEHRFQPLLRGPEEHQQRESSYTTPMRSEGGGHGQHSQSASSMSYQGGTRQAGSHQLDRGFASSPKREPGGQ
ncbi:hypothetical protein PMIN01_08726 [Paraphaeosphaeria minitans]|uniref:Uncharacterized protein n=1 Tax=Paraphaeosphaeria minitans TaxID=565426 RepID=A0A9P6KNY6_9PLEO|nr:hypothetical protein PMIN01_08726 [Paraphaeosphaeria minitans]